MRTRARQQGVAIITALLLTTLSITIVASLFWQQQVQVRSMENQRLHLQTKWILRGALDWARLVLRQDGMDSPEYTSLRSVWSTPLADTRLDQYIERERVEGEVFNATLSGRVLDACARFNLANLAESRVIDKDQSLVYRRLLAVLQLDPALADRTALAVASSAPVAPVPLPGSQNPPVPPPTGPTPVPSNGTEPIALTRVEDLLAIPGYTPEIIEKLRDFVIVLPEHTPINVNTAPAEVLAALLGVSLSEGSSLVSRREQADYRNTYEFQQQARVPVLPDEKLYALKSEFFLVNSRIRLDRAALDAQALVNRKTGPGAVTTTVWVRQF